MQKLSKIAFMVPQVNFSNTEITSMAVKVTFTCQRVIFAQPEVSIFLPEMNILKPEVGPIIPRRNFMCSKVIYVDLKWPKTRLNAFLCKNRQKIVFTLPEVNFSNSETTSITSTVTFMYQEVIFAKPEVTIFLPEVKILKPEVKHMDQTKILMYPKTNFDHLKWIKITFLCIFKKF